jgi:hypothetical protein
MSCCSSLGDLLLLSRQADALLPVLLTASCRSLPKFALYFFIIVIMKCYEEKMAYSYVMLLLFHKYFLKIVKVLSKCSCHHCNL